MWLAVSGFMVMELVSRWSLANHSNSVFAGVTRIAQLRWMLARGILQSGRTHNVSFRPFPNSSSGGWLISSVFLIRISCHKTTHANGYYGAWPSWAVSISVLPLTEPQMGRMLTKSNFYHEGKLLRKTKMGNWTVR